MACIESITPVTLHKEGVLRQHGVAVPDCGGVHACTHGWSHLMSFDALSGASTCVDDVLCLVSRVRLLTH